MIRVFLFDYLPEVLKKDYNSTLPSQYKHIRRIWELVESILWIL